jgi:hypothetical protein
MKKILSFNKFEKGQALPILVIGLLVMVMMAALMIDGGMLLSHRRTAQAAADAGALAGAAQLCPGVGGTGSATTAATDYVTRNNAQVVGISFPQSTTIRVETSVSSQAFFARIFEYTGLTAAASAEANCSPVSTARSTLPVAFPCLSPTYDENGIATDCKEIKFWDDGLTYEQNVAAGNLFFVMNSDSLSLQCASAINPDGINCDINNDGNPDIVAMSDDGWISLDGSSNPTNLEKWISGTLEAPEIAPRTWLGSQRGNKTNIYKILKNYEDETFIVPIFDVFCPNGDPRDKCGSLWVDGDIDTYIRTGSGLPHYRIIAFAEFKLRCVFESGADKDGKLTRCPFRNYLIEHPDYDIDNSPSLASIEGHFTGGLLTNVAGNGIDQGLFVVQLTK